MEQIMQYLTPEYLFGFGGGMLATALLTAPVKSFWLDKIGTTKLKKWQSRVSAFIAALVVALAWGLYAGEISWLKIPAIAIAYTVFSGLLYEAWKKYILKKE